MILTCTGCGKSFVHKDRVKYHSLKCYQKNRGKIYHGNKGGHWKGGIKHCDGYIFLFTPTHPAATSQGYVFEHRLVMEKSIGRFLVKGEVVHHVDGDKANNQIENLVLTTQGSHTNMHRKDLVSGRKVTRIY